MSHCEVQCGSDPIRQYEDYLIYKCENCNLTHYIPLPTQKDFDIGPYGKSSRLKKMYRLDHSIWFFENFNGDSFRRTVEDPVKWLVVLKCCKIVQLSSHNAARLETFYGPFLHFPSKQGHEQLFKGYFTEIYSPSLVVTYFSDEIFKKHQNTAEENTSGFLSLSSGTQRSDSSTVISECEPNPTSTHGASYQEHSRTAPSRTGCPHHEPRSNPLLLQSLERFPSTASTTKVGSHSMHELSDVTFQSNPAYEFPPSPNPHASARANLDVQYGILDLTNSHQHSRMQEQNQEKEIGDQQHEGETPSNYEKETRDNSLNSFGFDYKPDKHMYPQQDASELDTNPSFLAHGDIPVKQRGGYEPGKYKDPQEDASMLDTDQNLLAHGELPVKQRCDYDPDKYKDPQQDASALDTNQNLLAQGDIPIKLREDYEPDKYKDPEPVGSVPDSNQNVDAHSYLPVEPKDCNSNDVAGYKCTDSFPSSRDHCQSSNEPFEKVSQRKTTGEEDQNAVRFGDGMASFDQKRQDDFPNQDNQSINGPFEKESQRKIAGEEDQNAARFSDGMASFDQNRQHDFPNQDNQSINGPFGKESQRKTAGEEDQNAARFSDGMASLDQKRQHDLSNQDNQNLSSGQLTRKREEQKQVQEQSQVCGSLNIHVNREIVSSQHERSIGKQSKTCDLSNVECLPLNPENGETQPTGNKHVKPFDEERTLPLNPENGETQPTKNKHVENLGEESTLPLNPDYINRTSTEIRYPHSQGETSITYLNPEWIEQGLENHDQRIERPTNTANRTSKTLSLVNEYVSSNEPSIFEKFKTSVKSVVTGEFSRNMTVMSEIQKAFQNMYCYLNWRKRFPFFYPFHRMPASAVFDFTVKQGDEIHEQVQNIFEESKSCARKEILILGSPGFGKTTLCSLFAYHWALNVTHVGKFELCINCSLPEVINYSSDISEAIVIHCHIILARKDFSLESIRSALSKYSEDILLILDGYDQLPENRKKDVKQFLRNKNIFHKSTITVTSRPTSDETFMRIFDRLVFIIGLSAYSLRKSMESIEVPQNIITSFMNIIQENKLDYLCELPPLFDVWAARSIRDNKRDLSMYHSLYKLLKNVIWDLVIEEIKEAAKLDACAKAFHVLGKECFEQLVSGGRDFGDIFLEEPLRSFHQNFINWGLFHVPSGIHNTRVYRLSGKILKVFFATLYLRKLWRETSNRQQFLEEVFCCNGGSGDYVATGNTDDGFCLYYVGLIPEIVLKLGGKQSLDHASFEMFYDADRVEHSQAFDSVNLLLRVSDSYLTRYKFEIRPEDDDRLVNSFGDVMNMVPTENLCVNHFFYTNSYEGKDFLKLILQEPETGENVLYEIVRAKRDDQFDRICMDFYFLKLADLFGFVSSQLSHYLKLLSLRSNLMYCSMEDFVFELVEQLLECTKLRSAVVKCKGDLDPLSESYRINCTFKIVSHTSDGNPTNKVIFLYEGMHWELFAFETFTKDKSNFYKNVSDIKAFIRDCKRDSSNPRITIDLLLK